MYISQNNLAALTSTSNSTIKSWIDKGVYFAKYQSGDSVGFDMEDLCAIPEINEMVHNKWEEELKVTPLRDFTSIELFAGGGGLALGMEKAGFKHVLLNEFETSACNTLRVNRPNWNVLEGDVRHIDFTPLRDKVDFLSGGFPCQAFSFAGKQGGFDDVRGTLFFELARAVKEIRPKVFMGENVKGLISHDNGRTFKTICNVIEELGYTLVTPRILKGLMYNVPQKRERIILIGIRNDLTGVATFKWPSPAPRIMTLRDALFKGELYDADVPLSEGAKYPAGKAKVLDMVPQGGDWRSLPENIAKEYMGGSWFLGGGKTGMARRLSLDEPSLTLTCAPAQKQTERCHPLETRPLTVREYARIQTFPDDWIFQGTMSDKYKQIGNAVPVNLAWAIGRSLIRLFNEIQKTNPTYPADYKHAVRKVMDNQIGLITVKDRRTQTSVVKKDCRQLNLFNLFEEFQDSSLFENQCVMESAQCYSKSTGLINFDLIPNGNILVAYIKKEMQEVFEKSNGKIYYTGEKFPSTIPLNELYYFSPYIKGKGIRDIYVIRKICVRKNDKRSGKNPEYRMAFDLSFVGRMSDGYNKVSLDFFRTYKTLSTDMIRKLLR